MQHSATFFQWLAKGIFEMVCRHGFLLRMSNMTGGEKHAYALEQVTYVHNQVYYKVSFVPIHIYTHVQPTYIRAVLYVP